MTHIPLSFQQRLRPPPVPAEPWPAPSEPWPPEAPASPHADASGFCIPPDRSVLIKNCLKLTIRQRREALGLGDIAPDFKTAGPEEVGAWVWPHFPQPLSFKLRSAAMKHSREVGQWEYVGRDRNLNLG